MKASALLKKGSAKVREALARTKQIRESHVKVGLLGSKKAGRPESTLTNAQVAIYNEFGTSSQPARPFLRPAIVKHRDAYLKFLEKGYSAAIKGETEITQSLGLLGQRASADVKNFVTQGEQVPPPNAPATLARKLGKTRKGSKGSPRTLVDTGRMVNAITYEVVKGKAK